MYLYHADMMVRKQTVLQNQLQSEQQGNVTEKGAALLSLF